MAIVNYKDYPDTLSGAWKSPELPIFLFFYILIGLLAIRQNILLDDLDVCWLIRTGELIWQTGQLPATDVFSFTHQGQPWILYQWGFELFVGGLHLLAGLGGVVWGAALLISLAYSILFHFLLRLGINRGICIGLIVLTMLANSFHWLSRPNTASILFYIFLLTFLEGYRKSPGNRIWYLPLLFLLWANVHLGFTSGLMVMLLYGIWAWFMPKSFRPNGGTRDYRLLIAFALCLLSTFINPYGPRLFSYLWELSQASTMNARIGELLSPNFHSTLLFFIIIQIVLIFWFGNQFYPGRGLLLTLISITLAMGMHSLRHIPYFSIPATIHLAYSWKERKGNFSTPPSLTMNQIKGWGWGLLAAIVSLLWVVLIAHWHPGFYHFDEKRVPEGATAYLENNVTGSMPSRIFTAGAGGQWNDYFIYRLYPRIHVFIDTRFDMYGDTFFKNYLVLADRLRCDLTSLDLWKFEFLIFQKIENGKKDKEKQELKTITIPSAVAPWKLVYEDEQAVVYQNMAKSSEK